ncbi:MAG TPA: DUF4345 domain-containing protein [Thermohalobaculum sp.]|nr:DUF4345 domain-containing protein [Thermohalobaculum sp.]
MNIKNSKALRTMLFISGLIAAGVGGAILSVPVAFYAAYGIEIGSNISLLNEIRAPGGALLASGMFIMSGAFVARLTATSAVVSALLYVPYGLSRILSMAIDGMPDEGLVQAAVLETAIGLIWVFSLVKYRES